LTKPQQELYDHLLTKQREGGPMPSCREMMKAMGLKSTAPVQARLNLLIRKGYVGSVNGGHRNIRVYDPMTVIHVPEKYAQQVKEYVELLQESETEEWEDFATA
ncbi:MAG TPA: repressor LexA, partial [Candidatus Paceibacterota bacterium]|nr:repressor LexA [Candidatus Paceibacterota bacterium]